VKHRALTHLRPLAALALLAACASETGSLTSGMGGEGGQGAAGSATAGGSTTGGTAAAGGTGGSTTSAGTESGGNAGTTSGSGGGNSAGEGGEGGAPACTTRISYGSGWIHSADRTDLFDVVGGDVRWDGKCVDEGSNSYAVLSNGFKPYFTGHAGCIIGLDHTDCDDVPTACSTRIGYGDAWQEPSNHPNRYDDVKSAVTWNGACTNGTTSSAATLSNGWGPHFDGQNSCSLGFSYQECGGVYQNPVKPEGCADPGMIKVDDTYYVACTGGGSATAFALSTSTDLVHYKSAGHIFTATARPSWTKGDYWAPELHRVKDRYVAYYTARHQDGRLSIGAATATDPLGPYTDIGAPLVQEPGMGAIDANYFEAADGTPYLLWKIDGNAAGKPTPIYGQKLAADGLSLTGTRTELITNDLAWEGAVVEGPWVIREGDYYYLFYSGNSYANQTYAVGVARATNPMGPYTKRGNPILTSNARWVGPGHCSVVRGPRGDWQMVYHAWPEPRDSGRLMLVDPIRWVDGWPTMPQTPSLRSVPMP
jgi:arabinan endo-1,5-alpha-L-arabinosidase